MVKKAIHIIYTNYLVKVMFTRIICYELCSVGRSVGVGRVGARQPGRRARPSRRRGPTRRGLLNVRAGY